jgi:hypothetical protein
MPDHRVRGQDQSSLREVAAQLQSDVEIVAAKPEPLVKAGVSDHRTQG